MTLFRDLVNPGGPRVHAWVTLCACASLCLALNILAVAALCKRSVAGEISTVSLGLSALIGWVYKTGKSVEASASPAPSVVDVPGSCSTGGGAQ